METDLSKKIRRFGKILVLDKDPESGAYLEKMLAEWGYKASTFSSPDESLNCLRQNRHDLVVLDACFDDMTLPRLILDLKSARKEAAVLVINASNDSDELQEALEAGAADCFSAPLNPAELSAAIRRLLSRGSRGTPLKMSNYSSMSL